MSLTVPLPRPATAVDATRALPGTDRVRLGRLDLGPAVAYLLVWALVLFAVQVLAVVLAHLALDRLGVLASVSSAGAAVLGTEEPVDGVLPALELPALLPWVLIGAAVASGLWLLASLLLVLLHNTVCRLTGGLRVRVRPEG